MIEKVVRDFLAQRLNVPVYTETPEEIPQRYVIIEKTGSGKANRVNHATIAIKSHAETMYQASVLNDNAKDAMNALIEIQTISKSELNSDYNYTNTTDKHYRYQAVYNIVYVE